MAKKKVNKNRSARERVRWQEEKLRREWEKRNAELNEELRLIFGCLVVAFALLAAVLIFAPA